MVSALGEVHCMRMFGSRSFSFFDDIPIVYELIDQPSTLFSKRYERSSFLCVAFFIIFGFLCSVCRTVRIAFLGYTGSGKSSFLNRLLKFPEAPYIAEDKLPVSVQKTCTL